MAISGYNSVSIENNVPFNNDPGQVINEGDMLYWNPTYQAFEVGPGIFKLSDLENDLNYITQAQLDQILAGFATNGTLDLTTFVTESELSAAIQQINGFSGAWADITGTPTTLAGYGITDAFSGDYNQLTNKPTLFSGYYDDLIGAPNVTNFVTTSQLNTAIGNIDYSNLASKAYVNNALQNIDYSYLVTEAELANALQNIQFPSTQIDLTGYYSKTEVDALLNNLAAQETDAQTLSISGNTLTISNGNSVDLDTVLQDLSINGTLLSITEGNTLDLEGAILSVAPSLDGVATEAWVQAQNYLTSVDLPDEQTLSFVNGVLSISGGNSISLQSLTPDLTNYATQTFVTDAISQIPGVDLTGYATQDWVNSRGFITEQTDNQLLSLNSGVLSISGGNTVNLNSIIPTIDLTPYYTKTEVDALVDSAIDASTDSQTLTFNNNVLSISGGNSVSLASLVDTVDLSGYATIGYVDSQSGNVDLTEYYTKTEVDTLIADVVAGDSDNQLLTLTDNVLSISGGNAVSLSHLVDIVDLSPYYTKTEVDAIIQQVIQDETDNQTLELNGNILSITDGNAIDLDLYAPNVDLTGYATEDYVNQQIAGAPTDLSGYATEAWVQSQNFLTAETDNQTLTLEGDLLGITEGNTIDLSNLNAYYSKSEIDSLLALVTAGAANAQTLSISGNTLSISDGNSVDLDTVLQDLSINGTVISISEGNWIDIQSALPDVSNFLTDTEVTNLVNEAILQASLGTTHPVNVSYFTNDAGYITALDLTTTLAQVYNDLQASTGWATEQYVDDRWAETVITGERHFTDGIVFEDFVQQKLSTVNAEAVKRELVLAVQTTNDIETEVLFSDSSRVAIATGTTAMFKATVVASSGTDKTAFIVKGVIDYTGAGISIVGTNIVETISDSDLGWTADFTADSVNDALKITVTGSPTTTIDWTVFLEISEVIR